jgi:murein DD-endopeptidase MepM/ murein hydrolase activator NlpD
MDGLMHAIKPTDTLESIAAAYKVSLDQIKQVNNIASLLEAPEKKVFVPEARLSSFELRKVWGELFSYPIRGPLYVSSWYGYRDDPIAGGRTFHNGLDMAAAYGSTAVAAMAGTVQNTGYDASSGNYIVIGHMAGYATFYGHLSVISVVPGQWVKEGQKIGEVGSTGYSTGPHLHFTVLKNGRTVNPAVLLH